MARCKNCKKKCSCPIQCNSCKLDLCTRCIDISIHECTNLKEYIDEKRKILEEKLLSNKTIDKKITTI